ncbi:MAG: N-6 DNA methylase [Candidatus Nanopusillus sp.]
MEKKINDYLNNSTKLSKKDLFTALKQGADLIRTGLDYRSLLIFLFYKAISDRYESEVNRIIKEEGLSREEAYIVANSEFKMYDENTRELITWKEITKKSNYLEEFQNALIKFAELNPDIISKDLMKALLDKLGISHLESEHKARLDQIKRIFDKLDFSNVDYDIIGDAYMYILAQFAPTKGKEGEVYTPYEVIKLLIRLIDPEPGSDILDPAMGSGAMLIEAYKYTKKRGRVRLFGQEYNPDMAAIAKLNFVLHGIEKNLVKIQVGDSLKKLKFDENSQFEVDYVVANPPWNQDGYGEKTLGKDISLRKIYKYGFPPNNNADWAWIQLMLYYAKKKVGVILDQGALSREGKEKAIREKIVNDDLIEAIILLPEKLFYNTQSSLSGIIIIFNKEKQEDRKRKILFIDATDLYVKHPEVRRLNKLSDEHIQKIVETYREFKTIPGFSRVVNIEEIIKNNYNLNVSLYVSKIQNNNSVSIEEIKGLWKNIEGIRKEREEKEKELEEIIKIIVNKNE